MQSDGKKRGPTAGGRQGQPADDIAGKLKSFYQSVEQEPVPTHLLDLLDRLDRAERGQDASSDE